MARAFNKILNEDFILGGRSIILGNCSKDNEKISVVNLPGSLHSYILSLKYLFYLKQNPRINIVYAREERLLFFIILYNKLFFKLKLKFVYESHGVPNNDHRLFAYLVRSVDRIIVLTSPLKRKILELYKLEENKIMVAPDGVESKYLNYNVLKNEARSKVGLPIDKSIVMYTGSFFNFAWKGVDVVLDSLKDFDNETIFVLVGGTADEIRLVMEKYKSSNLILVENVEHELIFNYLKSADILLLPNKSGNDYSEYYTSPMKLFEYMVSKVPIIASNLPSIRDILNENNSVLVKPNSSTELTLAIRKLLTDSVVSIRLSEQAFVDVQNYTWDKRAEHIIKFLSL